MERQAKYEANDSGLVKEEQKAHRNVVSKSSKMHHHEVNHFFI